MMTFPLVLPLEPMKVLYKFKFSLFAICKQDLSFYKQLQSYASNSKFDQSTKIQPHIPIKNNKYTKVIIKRYFTHIKA